MNMSCRCINCITPPHMLKKLLESKNNDIRQHALNTLLATARLRGERAMATLAGAAFVPGNGRRTVYDCQNTTSLNSDHVLRTENGEPSADESANRAFDGLGATRDFFRKEFDRDSIDDNGMRLDAYVHFGNSYNNAFWNGRQMVFGDGDGELFCDFTLSLDVIAHELTHGVTEYTANLEYHRQSGALNESMSDVFGSLVKQWVGGQTADEADWLIGSEIFTPDVECDALRSLKAPGTAYDSPVLGKDPQPDHMDKYVHLPDTDEGDWGGVHINSGIPNKAFYLVATDLGGYAWEAAGHIWYETLRASNQNTQFQAFADETVAKADQIFGAGSLEQQAVVTAWREVGVNTSAKMVVSRGRPRRREGWEAESLAELTRQIETLTAQVSTLSKDVTTMKRRR